jgi:hypothetical protein
VRFGKIRLQFDSVTKHLDRLVDLVLLVKRAAEIGVKIGIVGPEANGGLESGDRFVEFVLEAQRNCEV